MLMVAIDGACRRNGQPDCTASGGAFYIGSHEPGENYCGVLTAYEYGSTNQRGELLALLKALDFIIHNDDEDNYIVTDSEYIFHAMTKGWYDNWFHKGWTSATGEPIKNMDIWHEIKMLVDKCHRQELELSVFHIKGHCIPFGRVTASNLLVKDPTGRALWNEVSNKFEKHRVDKAEVFKAAQELSERNNGYRLPDNVFKRFVVINTVADAVATRVVDVADSSRKR